MTQDALLFLAGSWAYPAIEMLWRGRTHASMALAGGICLCLINHVCCDLLEDRSIPSRCLAGAGVITGVELVNSGRTYTREELRERISGHLCRCTGYENILNALERVVGKHAPEDSPAKK